MIITFIAFLALITFVIIRHLLSKSSIRYLIDAYGLDHQKLSRLNKQELADLKKSINRLRKKNDPFGLESLIRQYKP